MKKVIFISSLILILSLSVLYAKTEIVQANKSFHSEYHEITLSEYYRTCRKTVYFLKTNSIFLAVHKQNSNSAYFYGIDKSGNKKVTINLKYSKTKILQVQLEVLVEGEIAYADAETIANALKEKLVVEFDSFLKKPNKFLFF